MNRDNLNAKQRAALEAIENFLLWYTSDEKTYARMWDAAFDYVEQDHVLISEEVSEVERLRKENKWWKDEHALLSRDEAASSLECRWLREENERLREALKKIHHEVTNDIAGLPRDEALNIITWVAETADAALRQEV
jgi:hypothetical protein